MAIEEGSIIRHTDEPVDPKEIKRVVKNRFIGGIVLLVIALIINIMLLTTGIEEIESLLGTPLAIAILIWLPLSLSMLPWSWKFIFPIFKISFKISKSTMSAMSSMVSGCWMTIWLWLIVLGIIFGIAAGIMSAGLCLALVLGPVVAVFYGIPKDIRLLRRIK